MLKTRLLAAIATVSLATSPALAKDTRSADALPPAKAEARQAPKPETLVLATAVSCDAPGNGNKTGHVIGNGRGHEIGRGRGHACDGASPG